MYRRLITTIATFGLLTALGGAALADPPVVSSAIRPDATEPGASGSAIVPTDTNTPVADLHMSDPLTARSGAGSNGTASSGGTALSGPGMTVSAPARASRGSGTPSASTPSTEPPTESHHASTPTDTSGTAIAADDQTLAVRSSRTSAGGSVSDPTSADMIAAFCFLAHANEASGRPTANVSSVCGDQPSTATGSAASDQGGASTGTGGLGGSLCVTGAADGGTPANGSVSTTCGSNPSTAGAAGNGAGSEGSTITPAMSGSVCASARASAQLSSTAEFASVCGGPSGTTPENAMSENAWTGRSASGSHAVGPSDPTTPNDDVAGSGVQLLPFTGTAAPTIAGLLLIAGAAAMSFLLKRKRV